MDPEADLQIVRLGWEEAASAVEIGGSMARHRVIDDGGRFSVQLEVRDPILQEAIQHENADDVIKCAMIIALSVLAQSGPWPGAALASMSSFMTEMKTSLIAGLH